MRKLANVQLLQGYLHAEFPAVFSPNLKNVQFCFLKVIHAGNLSRFF